MKAYRYFRFAAGIFLTITSLSLQAQIESAVRLTAHPKRYCRIDFVTMLVAEWTNNAYCSKDIRLDMDLTSPSGLSLVVPAYYEKGKSGLLSTWRTRFTPIEEGEYMGKFVLTQGAATSACPKLSFKVGASDQKGFLHAGDDWAFRFDNGERFRGLGENIAWESRTRDDSRYFHSLQESPRYNYEYMLGMLAANGGNFFRTWMCPWNLPLEWKQVANTNRYSNDPGRFNPSAEQRMDQLVDLAESLDLYMMLTLDNSGDFQGFGWRHSSYNQTNGGKIEAPQDFFTDPQAKAQYKDRLRYLVARWGYSPHIAAWEFFNEIDNLMYGLPDRIPDDVITQWHSEMSSYLKNIDPYHHLITTSISHREVAGLNDIPSMDFNQRHIYGHDGRSTVSSFPEVLRHDSRAHRKPYVIGEYGYEWDWSRNFDDFASNMDGDFKKGLWLGLFSPTPILPMSWWWEYFDHRNMTGYFQRVRFVLDQMTQAGGGSYEDAKCQWDGPALYTVAVRCGQSVFVLLINDKASDANGTLTLPLGLSQNYKVSAFDPDANLTKELFRGRSTDAQKIGVGCPGGSEIILTISPI